MFYWGINDALLKIIVLNNDYTKSKLITRKDYYY